MTGDDRRLYFVLCNPKDPRNVGGACRAVANFEVDELRVVSDTTFDDEDLKAYSAGSIATMTLRFFPTVDAAVADCDRVIGTSRRTRDPDAPPEWPIAGLRERLVAQGATAILFGTERTGLTTAEVDRCSATVHIHTGETYPSMNLAHAIACVGYELARPTPGESGPPVRPETPRTGAEAREAFFGHVQRVVDALGYPPGRSPEAFTRRVRRILERANPNQQELSLFGGVFTEMLRLAKLAGATRRED